MGRRSHSEEEKEVQRLAEQLGVEWLHAVDYADNKHKVARHILLSAGFHPGIPTPTETSKLELLDQLSRTLHTCDALRKENQRLKARLEPLSKLHRVTAAKRSEIIQLLWTAWKMALAGYHFTEAELEHITDTVAGYWHGQKKRKAADTRGKGTAAGRKSTTDL